MPTTPPLPRTVPACVRLDANVRGRDFIASDLHGCHAALMRALEAVRFDPATGDRLLLGGDLIDRGAESLACLRLLREPWVHACLGNHEAMLLTWLGRRHSDWHDAEDFTDNGGQWAEDLLETAGRRDLTEFWELATLVERLPLVLTVDDTVMPFNVSHGDLLPLLEVRRAGSRWQRTPQERLRHLKPLASEHADAAVWGRTLAFETDEVRPCAQARLADDVLVVSATPVEPGLALTYVGHTPMPTLRLHRSRLFIDRGAAFACADEPEWKLALVQHRQMSEVLATLAPGLTLETTARPTVADERATRHPNCYAAGTAHPY